MSDQDQEGMSQEPHDVALRGLLAQIEAGQKIDYKDLEKTRDAYGVLVFAQIGFENDRTAAVIAGAYVEEMLEAAIRSRLPDDEKIIGQSFRPDDLIGSYGKKMRFGLLLGLYTETFRKDLKIIGEIRNAFAHNVRITSFQRDPIRAHCNNINIFKTNIHRLPEGKGSIDKQNRYPTFGYVGGGYEKLAADPKQRFITSVQLMTGHLQQIINHPHRPPTADHFDRPYGDDPIPEAPEATTVVPEGDPAVLATEPSRSER